MHVNIADICIFAFFMTLGILRVIIYPRVARTVVDDFSQTSYLGAAAVAFETIMYQRQKQHSFSDINGAWFLTFIPFIVDSTVGGAISPYLSYENSVTVLVTSFLMWSVGVGMSLVILSLYFWRLMSCQLPPREAIISTFVPVGPFGMGAYSIQQMAVGLASQVREHRFTLARPPQPPNDVTTMATIAEGIHWLGIIVALVQLGIAWFLLVEACLSVCAKVPKTFNVEETLSEGPPPEPAALTESDEVWPIVLSTLTQHLMPTIGARNVSSSMASSYGKSPGVVRLLTRQGGQIETTEKN
ncbi:Plasma membrane sulfite pump involved in sulfite metabolism, partial [Exophiala xenobiotica]